MGIKEKIDLAAKPHQLYFFKEGMFYKLYNLNAMWFQRYITAYKINVKFVKTVKQHVFSLGFPQSVLLAKPLVYKNKALKEIEKTPHFIAFKITETIEKQVYLDWCNQQQNVVLAAKETTLNNETVLQELNNFDLANKTPMQAFDFVARLKKATQSTQKS